MSGSIKMQQKANILISNERETAVQTALTGSTVYTLPKRTPQQNMVDLVLMIMNEDGPLPMYNLRPGKKTRNAVDQFYDEHQAEYEGTGQQSYRGQMNRVHTHNTAFPKMYDELDKRRSIAQVGMTGSGGWNTALRSGLVESWLLNNNSCIAYGPTKVPIAVDPWMGDHPLRIPIDTPPCLGSVKAQATLVTKLYETKEKGNELTSGYSSNQMVTSKFDPKCPKCNKRKKRREDDRKRWGTKKLCKQCRDELKRKSSRNRPDRVMNHKFPKHRKQQSRCRSTKGSKPSIICSNKCFQCYLTAETKTVSTFKSCNNLLPVVQEVTPPKLTSSINMKDNQEKNVLKSKSSHKKRVNKKPASLKSEGNPVNPDTETGPSMSSYNSFYSAEHEPMIE